MSNVTNAGLVQVHIAVVFSWQLPRVLFQLVVEMGLQHIPAVGSGYALDC